MVNNPMLVDRNICCPSMANGRPIASMMRSA